MPHQIVERRFCRGLQVRDADQTKDGRIATLAGYAAKFNSLSEDLNGWREFIRAGAFKESLGRGDDIRALVDHDSALIVGRRSAGTLKIAEDEVGLGVEVAVPDTTAGRDLLVSVRRGDLTGMSFGFSVVKDEWTRQSKDGDTVYRRELIAVDLYEVSFVAWPAYTDTSVEARSGRSVSDILAEGVRRVAAAEPDARSRRDRLIAAYRARVALWTGA